MNTFDTENQTCAFKAYLLFMLCISYLTFRKMQFIFSLHTIKKTQHLSVLFATMKDLFNGLHKENNAFPRCEHIRS